MFASRKAGVVFLSWFGVVLWMSFIFFMSSRVGDDSADLSGSFLGFFGPFVRIFAPRVEDASLHVWIRKGAHLFEYMVLSILLINALRQHIEDKRRVYLFAVVVSLMYAVSDEVHQAFVPGRSASMLDVGIDGLGALLGVLIFQVFVQIFKPWRAGI